MKNAFPSLLDGNRFSLLIVDPYFSSFEFIPFSFRAVLCSCWLHKIWYLKTKHKTKKHSPLVSKTETWKRRLTFPTAVNWRQSFRITARRPNLKRKSGARFSFQSFPPFVLSHCLHLSIVSSPYLEMEPTHSAPTPNRPFWARLPHTPICPACFTLDPEEGEEESDPHHQRRIKLEGKESLVYSSIRRPKALVSSQLSCRLAYAD